MAGNLITSLLSLATNFLPSIRAYAHAPSSSSSNSNSSEKERARAVEDDLERLTRTLERIKATLYDAEEREIRERSVKLWLKELKKVAYDAEDVLSEYRYEVTRVQVEARKATQASSSHQGEQMEYIVPIFDGMVDRLKEIRSRFDEIAKDREALQLRESDGMRCPNNKTLHPLTSHMVDEASIFGRDAEVTEVIDFLLSENEKEKSFSVISIVGKGGLGKTTIAQLVYKELRDSQRFDLFGWVCVSDEFDVGRLTKAIIESVSEINYGLSELSSLQDKLAETVKGKTALLVLDDVWNENQTLWDSFRVSFKEAAMVRILVTTRHKKVADIMQTKTLFRPTNLPESSCWELFQHYAFSGIIDTVSTHLVDMGRDIMRKCGGLPLAVKSIASLLGLEKDEECWREILESDLWESNSSKDIFPALQISYAHLPAHLKPCFLFCSMYRKDYILKKLNLIELWISHGYIESRGKRKITEIGVEYYEELKQRSFLDDFSSRRHYECCKLHDIIHDLAQLISENEHFSVMINQPLYINEVKVPREAYHLYVGGDVGYAIQFHQQNLKGLRTLSMDLVGLSEELEGNLTKCESLRALKLHGYCTQIPHSNFKLKHLTYLDIMSAYLETLPLSIGLLYNLRTLILHCDSLEYLPESIGDLANLQFLNIQSYHIKKLPKSLCSLRNLLRLVIKCENLEEIPLDLRNLDNLHELTFFCDRTLALPNTIGCLSSLEEINFSSHSICYNLMDVPNFTALPPIIYSFTEPFNYVLGFVPHDLVNFRAIKKMAGKLRVRNIAWLKDMKSLEGRLSIEGLENSNLLDAQHANLRNKCKLKTLHLCWPHYLEPFFPGGKPGLTLKLRLEVCEDRLIGVDGVDFSLLECLQPHPNLKNLQISGYPLDTLPGWMRDPLSLQSIQTVSLLNCLNIQSLPFSNLQTLKHLKIYKCDSIRVLQLEQLPSQLKVLQIYNCDCLEWITGLGDLDMLSTLEILYCPALESLTTDGLQLMESTKSFGDSSYEKPHIGRQSVLSLTSLLIAFCYLFNFLPDGLVESWQCPMFISCCGGPDLIRNWTWTTRSDIFYDVFH